jgi:hypothetical protein
VVLLAKGHDRVGCLSDQVKLTHALAKNLDEAVKEIRQLGDHGKEAIQRIIDLEAMCKQHEEAAQKLVIEPPPPEKVGVCLPRSYRGILDEARIHKHISISVQYHDIQVIKYSLHIKCDVLEFTKDEAQKMLQQIDQSFTEAFISHGKHTLFALEESGLPRMTYTYESQWGTQPSSVWISH